MSYNMQATDLVYRYIVRKIRDREWLPGMKIATESVLCEELGVSRIAVRQALDKLAALSVLRREQGSGTYVEAFEHASLLGLPVYPGDNTSVRMVLDFRRMFDSYSAELFARSATSAELDLLEKNYAAMQAALTQPEELHRLDNEFHTIIVKGTCNQISIHIASVLFGLSIEDTALFYSAAAAANTVKYHGLILEALRSGSDELAAIYSRIHVDELLKLLVPTPN